jgi:hypothetical protein
MRRALIVPVVLRYYIATYVDLCCVFGQ